MVGGGVGGGGVGGGGVGGGVVVGGCRVCGGGVGDGWVGGGGWGDKIIFPIKFKFSKTDTLGQKKSFLTHMDLYDPYMVPYTIP